jgi:predicted DNA-binding transcriptional regulator YafY
MTTKKKKEITIAKVWYSANELAEYFSVSSKTIDRWRKRGDIRREAIMKLPTNDCTAKGFRYNLSLIESDFQKLNRET